MTSNNTEWCWGICTETAALSVHHNHLQGLLRPRSLGPTAEFWFSRSGVGGTRTCISSRFSRSANGPWQPTLRATEPGIHTPDYPCWVVWSSNRVKGQKKNLTLQPLGNIFKTASPLAQRWPSVYLARCSKGGIPVFTHSFLRYLGSPYRQHPISHQHVPSCFSHPGPARSRLLTCPRAYLTPRAQPGGSQAALISLSLGTGWTSQPRCPHHHDCSPVGRCWFYVALTAFQENPLWIFARGGVASTKQALHIYLKGVGSGQELNVFIPSCLIEMVSSPWCWIIPVSFSDICGPFSNTFCLFWLETWVASVTGVS